MAEVLDLDLLKPKARMLKLGGKEIDVSFIPTGITFAVDAVVQQMTMLDAKKIAAGDEEEIKTAFNLGVELCVVFCEHNHPEMTREWFHEHTNARQIRGLGEAIKAALSQEYEGIDPN